MKYFPVWISKKEKNLKQTWIVNIYDDEKFEAHLM